MIKEAYVSFEVAKLLKEKGFDVSCYGRYSVRSKEFHLDCTKAYNNGSNFMYSAPTHQTAMRWLREVHNLCIEVYVIKNYDKKICEYTYTIMDLNFPGSDDGIDCCNKYKTYEQACDAAIKYCSENLI